MFIECLTISSSIASRLQVVSYVKVHVYCVFDYFHFNLVSTSVGELFKSACLLWVWLFSFQSCLHFSRWVTWKCMFIAYLTIFLFNFDSTSVGELRECACLLCVWLFLFNLIPTLDCELRKNVSLLWVWLFSFQSCLYFRRWVM